MKPRRPALPVASGPRKQSQREIGTGVVGGCGMVAVSDPRVPVISTGCGGAPRGPGGLPGCPAASLEPAALVSGRPVNKDTGSVSSPTGAGLTSPPALPGWYSPHSSCPAWRHRAAAASWLCDARSAQPRGVLCPLPVGEQAVTAMSPRQEHAADTDDFQSQTPTLSCALMWAPHSMRCSRQSECPMRTATWRGVLQI